MMIKVERNNSMAAVLDMIAVSAKMSDGSTRPMPRRKLTTWHPHSRTPDHAHQFRKQTNCTTNWLHHEDVFVLASGRRPALLTLRALCAGVCDLTYGTTVRKSAAQYVGIYVLLYCTAIYVLYFLYIFVLRSTYVLRNCVRATPLLRTTDWSLL